MDRPDRQLGPPVDSARLQPDNQAETTAQRIDDSLVSGWLDNDHELAAELADERERIQRLQADEDLLLALQLHEFTGRPWDRFSRELARYGLGVLRVWIRRGTIYGKAKTLTGYGLGRIEGWPDPQTVEDLAADTVVAALEYFRDKVLKTHRWQSSGGASLGTFFIGQCLYQFANIYRSALRAELERIDQATVTPMAELPEDHFDIIKGIEETIVARDAVAEAMAQISTDRARRALLLQEVGFTQREIADQLGLPDAKSVENLIGYQHTRIRQIRGRTS
ncbi:RNA polymerase sigma factor [Mycolicibacterium moriokaense]|uniref:DNA-directed RNA polymerase specialized sigma24 family protein n=1 Tax=Mycolicibacterium moriokaense TaxID=39691 RepID=A0A318H760_9MYCO|nr:sigma-70 family RNA polymerase sigma factor [Mycolicibacterium moriokaense]PXW99601.1 DNA-directed RNA polymerase specialized sigma24 family protein [Mycolicibacterium moriokaense]